ncbi:DEAD/DEAH box helicase [Tenacibaculum geojense]|uniref:DEAD/DEAH box helicase n=1 Tax=Tenacibaculum geojense TaxID=915352 RepID=A0ABW3JTC6_9FLAO
MSNFIDLGLCEPINRALTDLGYEKPTVIQEKAIPQILSSQQDLKAFAQTGTGKTAAFSLPIVEQVDTENRNTQAIILSPTRELAVQIGNNIKEFAKYMPDLKVTTVYGGSNIDEQIRKLKKGVHIVVGTPGRTVDLINRRALKLSNVQWVVLDEADEMLNMGFKDELDTILAATPDTKQTLLFSATFPREVESIARNYMVDPVEVASGQKNEGSNNVTHEYYLVTERTRYPALKRIADINPNIYAIVFCRTRRETQEIADKLIQDGYNADSLHGDLSQAQRDSVMEKFRKKNIQMLVATDVAARGLDVDNLTHVINHKLPDQIENYNHRSGRTGRAGNTGVSIVLVNKKEKGRLHPIERILKKKFVHTPIPTGDEICKTQLFHLIDKVENTQINTEQIDAFLPNIYDKLADLSREELIQKFVSVEFNSFLSYYKDADDLNNLVSKGRATDRLSDENMTRFFINIGRKDRLNPAKLIGLINEQGIGKNVEIGAIDILDTFSFFEIDKNFEDDTLTAFGENNPEFSGRKVNVEVTKNDRKSGGGRRRGGNGGRRRDGGGRRKEASGGNKGGFGRRRSENKSGGSFKKEGNKDFGRKRRSPRRTA